MRKGAGRRARGADDVFATSTTCAPRPAPCARSSRMSERFDAGSVVKSSASGKRSAAAIATVVFPTPPLPPIRTTRRPARESKASFTVASVDADAGVVAFVRARGLPRHLLAPGADVAEGLEHLLLLDHVLL